MNRTVGLICKLRNLVPRPSLFWLLINYFINPLWLLFWPGAMHVNLTLKSFSGFKSKFLALCIFLSKISMQFLYFNIDDGVLPLKFSYYELLANLMFEIRHTNAPSIIQDLFQDISDIHSYNTRSSASNNFYLENSATSSTTPQGRPAWIAFPQLLCNIFLVTCANVSF